MKALHFNSGSNDVSANSIISSEILADLQRRLIQDLEVFLKNKNKNGSNPDYLIKSLDNMKNSRVAFKTLNLKVALERQTASIKEIVKVAKALSNHLNPTVLSEGNGRLNYTENSIKSADYKITGLDFFGVSGVKKPSKHVIKKLELC